MLKLLWPLVIVNLRIPGLIFRGTAYFVQMTKLLPLPYRKPGTRLGAKLEAWRQKMFHIFCFIQSDMIFGKHIPFSEKLIPSPARKVT